MAGQVNCYTIVTSSNATGRFDGGPVTITNMEVTQTVPSIIDRDPNTFCISCAIYSAQQAGSNYPEVASWLIRDAGGSTVAEASGTDSATFLGGICASCGLGSGSVSDTQCETCPAGKYSDINGGGPCLSCEPGRYSGFTGATSCSACEAGKRASASAAALSCVDECGAGKYSGTAGATSSDVCIECEAGKSR